MSETITIIFKVICGVGAVACIVIYLRILYLSGYIAGMKEARKILLGEDE